LADQRGQHPDAHCRILDVSLEFDRPLDGLAASDHYGVLAALDIGADQ
jgi:hypothetical protein